MAVTACYATETYTTENDDIDIEAVVNNLDTLKSYMDCFLDKKTCDAVPGDFKKDLPEAFEQACAKCTAAQKHIFRRYLEVAGEKLPEDLNALKKKYDPESKYFAPLQAAIANS
ncbi:unnamed protein product [Parnassius apollo]|uniref:(apollo) hypothetical protein n=1 Tax=Parnassius apollo TaxID=110799 RepID=A0A8S3Y172_PARAO|nr:unnamed protein product [Parnassius apollo]